jgi:hypothetical protein
MGRILKLSDAERRTWRRRSDGGVVWVEKRASGLATRLRAWCARELVGAAHIYQPGHDDHPVYVAHPEVQRRAWCVVFCERRDDARRVADHWVTAAEGLRLWLACEITEARGRPDWVWGPDVHLNIEDRARAEERVRVAFDYFEERLRSPDRPGRPLTHVEARVGLHHHLRWHEIEGRCLPPVERGLADFDFDAAEARFRQWCADALQDGDHHALLDGFRVERPWPRVWCESREDGSIVRLVCG